jgi:hypothetical protein
LYDTPPFQNDKIKLEEYHEKPNEIKEKEKYEKMTARFEEKVPLFIRIFL